MNIKDIFQTLSSFLKVIFVVSPKPFQHVWQVTLSKWSAFSILHPCYHLGQKITHNCQMIWYTIYKWVIQFWILHPYYHLDQKIAHLQKLAGDLLEDIGLFVPTKDLQFTSKFNLHDIFKHWWLFYSWYISEDREHKSIIVSLIAITTWVVTHNPWAMPHKPWDTQI